MFFVLQTKYGWVDGWSLVAHQIVHAVYNNRNPNALILFRDPEFMDVSAFKELPLRDRAQYAALLSSSLSSSLIIL